MTSCQRCNISLQSSCLVLPSPVLTGLLNLITEKAKGPFSLIKDTNLEKSETPSSPPLLYWTTNCFDSKGCFSRTLCAFKSCIFMGDHGIRLSIRKVLLPKRVRGHHWPTWDQFVTPCARQMPINVLRVAAKLQPISNLGLRLVIRSVCRRYAKRRRAVPCSCRINRATCCRANINLISPSFIISFLPLTGVFTAPSDGENQSRWRSSFAQKLRRTGRQAKAAHEMARFHLDGFSESLSWEKRAGGQSVAQTSKSAVSWVSKPAPRADTEPTWKSAIRQVWKPALRNFGTLL